MVLTREWYSEKLLLAFPPDEQWIIHWLLDLLLSWHTMFNHIFINGMFDCPHQLLSCIFFFIRSIILHNAFSNWTSLHVVYIYVLNWQLWLLDVNLLDIPGWENKNISCSFSYKFLGSWHDMAQQLWEFQLQLCCLQSFFCEQSPVYIISSSICPMLHSLIAGLVAVVTYDVQLHLHQWHLRLMFDCPHWLLWLHFLLVGHCKCINNIYPIFSLQLILIILVKCNQWPG